MLPHEVFLSHSSKNRTFANRLVKILVSHGIPVFYSKRSILGAQQWHDEIGSALARCDWFILILSPEAVKAEWVKRELLYALQSDRYRERIIPLLYQRCDQEKLSWTLSSIQRINFKRDFHKGCQKLLKIWGVGYRHGSSADTAKSGSPKGPKAIKRIKKN